MFLLGVTHGFHCNQGFMELGASRVGREKGMGEGGWGGK